MPDIVDMAVRWFTGKALLAGSRISPSCTGDRGVVGFCLLSMGSLMYGNKKIGKDL